MKFGWLDTTPEGPQASLIPFRNVSKYDLMAQRVAPISLTFWGTEPAPWKFLPEGLNTLQALEQFHSSLELATRPLLSNGRQTFPETSSAVLSVIWVT